MLKDLLITIRPKQWTKNLIIFAGILFAGHLFELSMLLKSTVAFLLFCTLSGAVYIINDLLDREKDRAHPIKQNRPIPAGRLPISIALIGAICLFLIGIICGFFLNLKFGFTGLAYFLLLTVYSIRLKNIVIVDVLTIAIGFVLRAVAGAEVIEVPISSWLLVCTVLIALFLALGKRRHELLLLNEEDALSHRQILKEYRPELLEQMITVVASASLVAYALYTMSPEIQNKYGLELYLTIPFVIYGIFRYMYLMHLKDEGGNPSIVLLTDKPLLIDVLLWGIAVTLILYI